MFGKLFGGGANVQELLENGATVVDVRTPGEFAMGNYPGSVNIPLDQIQMRLDELKKIGGPIVLCCASGARSGQAKGFLAAQGLDVHNAGPWSSIGR